MRPNRQWVASPQAQHMDGAALQLRVMSFNVLSDAIRQTTAFLYRNVHDPRDAWPRRRPRVVGEVQAYAPDVVGMQEVERGSGLLQDMQALGYGHVYGSRTGLKPDGCAVFWKTARLQCVAQETIQMCDHDLNDNVAIVVALRPVSAPPGAPDVIVGNTHILFNNKRGDTKLGQRLAADGRPAAADGSMPPAVATVMGDFNSTATSGIYEFLVRGELDLGRHDVRNISGQNPARPTNSGRSRFFNSSSSSSGPGSRHNGDRYQGGGGRYQGGGGNRHQGGGFRSRGSGGGYGGRDGGSRGAHGGRGNGGGYNNRRRSHSGAVAEGVLSDAEADDTVAAHPFAASSAAAQHNWPDAALQQVFGYLPPERPVRLLQHGLHLASAYAACLGHEPPFTSHNCKTSETLDYIFFSHQPLSQSDGWQLSAIAALDVPPEHLVRGGGPNGVMPSDHISLVADFAVVPAHEGA